MSSSINVVVKNQGKSFDVEVDPTGTGEDFKLQLYSLTGVQPDRQKILIKGKQVKDDTPLASLNLKPAQMIMMMGTPSESMETAAPRPQMKFMEDMTEAEAARAEGATPAGLQNLGNTCYLNSTLQTLRAVPELQDELAKYKATTSGGIDYSQFGLTGPASGSATDLTGSLRDLFKQMSETQEGFPPLVFLSTLRNVFPQFAQKSRTGNGYAQQDAEEAWSQIISQLRQKLQISGQEGSGEGSSRSFVDEYMAVKKESTLKNDENAEEEAVNTMESFFKLDCHIDKDTNHLKDGMMNSLEEKIEKRSETLGREAMYTKTSRVARLPKYLTVHFVRFFWKREAQKKAKIMRKVTFPMQLDAVEFCTPTLRDKLIPVRDKLREIRKDEEDVMRSRKRQKTAHQKSQEEASDAKMIEEPLQKAKQKEEQAAKKTTSAEASISTSEPEQVYKTDAEFEAERAEQVRAAKQELFGLIDKELLADEGSNKSGIYELRGVVTHQGASADSGHYTAYVKKVGALDPTTGRRKDEDGKWWWFNDDKVSEVDEEKIETLSGGGESHSALILLYKAVDLPTDATGTTVDK